MTPRPRTGSPVSAPAPTVSSTVAQLVTRTLHGPPLPPATTTAIQELLDEFPHLRRADRG